MMAVVRRFFHVLKWSRDYLTFTLKTARPDILISLGVMLVIFMILELLAVFFKWGQS